MLSKLQPFTTVALAGLVMPSCQTGEKEQPSPPNILILQADDMGWSDLSLHGNQILETPYLDSLAGKSMQFSSFYVNPVSAPTRASLLTGRHFLRTGVSHVHGGKDYIHLDETIFAETFRDAGYATGMWGKWHSGHSPGYYPWERGFDEAYRSLLYDHETNEGWMNGEPIQHEKWADQVLVDYALDFIDRNREKPFLAYVSFLTPHAPLIAPDKYVKKYMDKGLSRKFATLYGMIDHMDFHVHRLIQQVNQWGLGENTIILFLSDNGPAIINNDLTDAERTLRYVNNLKGHKGNIWENGVKSPLFACWPNQVKPGKTNYLADVTDIYPTLLEAAGIKLPPDHLPLDGKSFLPVVTGKASSKPGKTVFNYAHAAWQPTKKAWTPVGVMDEYRPVTASMKNELEARNQVISIRTDRYKLIRNPKAYHNTPGVTENFVLFDMIEDPMEEHNMYHEKPEIAESLKKELYHWFDGIKSSEHVFQMPIFQIGAYNYDSYPVLAFAPSHLPRQIKNAYNFVNHWNMAGVTATYRIQVQEPGLYQPVLEYTTDTLPENLAMLTFNNDTVVTKLDKKNKATFQAVELEKGYQEFHFSFQGEGKMDGELDNFFEIRFQKNQ